MFWKEKKLDQLNEQEWESLCDGCAKCCVQKLHDPESDEIAFTWVHCQLLECKTSRCQDYPNRLQKVKSCLKIEASNISKIASSLPKTCAYRLIHEQKDLPHYHHLICGDRELIHKLDKSIQGKTMSELDIDSDELFEFIVEDDEF